MAGWGGWSLKGVATGQAERVKCWSSELPTVGDGNLGTGFAALGALGLHLLYHVQPLHYVAEHHMFPIQPAGTERLVRGETRSSSEFWPRQSQVSGLG